MLYSFGYKYGQPVHTNFVLDVRCLPNPFWVPNLRDQTGMDAGVAEYVLSSESGKKMLEQSVQFITFWLTQQEMAKKSGVRIAIGCTGGRHRSVAMVEALGQAISADWDICSFHKDIDKDVSLQSS